VEKDEKYDPAKSKYEYVIFITRSATPSDETSAANPEEEIDKTRNPKKKGVEKK
jgi:hypothetical protein